MVNETFVRTAFPARILWDGASASARGRRPWFTIVGSRPTSRSRRARAARVETFVPYWLTEPGMNVILKA